jgi:hypothetical protein
MADARVKYEVGLITLLRCAALASVVSNVTVGPATQERNTPRANYFLLRYGNNQWSGNMSVSRTLLSCATTVVSTMTRFFTLVFQTQ